MIRRSDDLTTSLWDFSLSSYTFLYSRLCMHHPSTMKEFDEVVWCATQLCRGQPPPDKTITSSIVCAFAARMDNVIEMTHEKSSEVLMNMLWTFSYLSVDNEQIEMILSSGVIGSLKKLCRNPKFHSVPLLQTLANLMSGNESQKQALLDANIMEHMETFLGTSSVQTRKEAHRLLSNIAAGSSRQALQVISNPAIMDCVVEAARSERNPIRKEALWTLINLCTGDHPPIIPLLNAGGLKPLVDMLTLRVEVDLLLAALDAIDAILKDGLLRPGEGYTRLLEEYDGIRIIENLQDHDSDDIFKKAVKIIEEYFGVEEEDENLAPSVNENRAFEFGALSPPAPKVLFDSEDATQKRQMFNFGGCNKDNYE